jgi:hypothetical protein
MFSKHVWRLVLTLLFLKLAYLGLLAGVLWLSNDFDLDNFESMMARWPRSGPAVFASRFATWDAAHYLYLSEVGYQHDVPSCAFDPLWPLLVRWSSPLFGGSHVLTGMVLANLFSLAAWAFFYWLVVKGWGKTAAKWALAFLIAFPGSVFFQFNYTESLFLLLVLVLWWGLSEERFGWCWIVASLLPLTRGVGVFAVLPIAWHALAPAWAGLRARFYSPQASTRQNPLCPAGNLDNSGRGHLAGFEHSDVVNRRAGAPGILPPRKDSGWTACEAWGGGLQGLIDRCWLLWAPVLGWALYLALMWNWTGNAFEGMQAQKYWGVHSISNLWNVPKFVIGFFSPTQWHGFRGSVLDRSVFVLLLSCLPVLWRLEKELLVWVYILGVLPAMSGTFTSFTRFASCAFPLFIGLGVLLNKRQWRWPRYGILALFVVLHLVLLWRFVNFRWAG